MARTMQLAENVLMPMMSMGTYRLGGDKLAKIIDMALNIGYRSVDTARLYENEADLGQALKEYLPKYRLKREHFFITSKILPAHASAVPDLVSESLRDLQTDYIDLMLIHYPMCVTTESAALLADNMEMWSAINVVNTKADNKEWRINVWKALEQMQKQGKVRSIGVSNYEARHLHSMKRYATIFPVLNQFEFHPHLQRPEIIRTCNSLKIQMQAYAPLGRQQPALLSAHELNKVAADHRASVAQVLIAWALQKGMGVVPRSDNPNRIMSNYAAEKLKLTADDMKLIDSMDIGQAYTSCAPWKVE